MPYYFNSGTQESLAYICGYLRDNGFQCRIFDANYHSRHRAGLLARLAAYEPHVVGLSAMTHEIQSAVRVAGRIKDSLDVPIVIGGYHAGAAADDIDGLIHREGDEVTINARPALLTPRELDSLPLPALDDYFGEGPGDADRRVLSTKEAPRPLNSGLKRDMLSVAHKRPAFFKREEK